MKIHRLYLAGVGPSNDFIVRIPNVRVNDAQIYVEYLSIDTGQDISNVNTIEVSSLTLYDPYSYSSEGRSFNVIAQLANNRPVNSGNDFRYQQTINKNDVGYPLKYADFSGYSFNITLNQDNHAPIGAGWSWTLRLLIIDGEPKNDLVLLDPTQGSYLLPPLIEEQETSEDIEKTNLDNEVGVLP